MKISREELNCILRISVEYFKKNDINQNINYNLPFPAVRKYQELNIMKMKLELGKFFSVILNGFLSFSLNSFCLLEIHHFNEGKLSIPNCKSSIRRTPADSSTKILRSQRRNVVTLQISYLSSVGVLRLKSTCRSNELKN